jgi:hypothetical protein
MEQRNLLCDFFTRIEYFPRLSLDHRIIIPALLRHLCKAGISINVFRPTYFTLSLTIPSTYPLQTQSLVLLHSLPIPILVAISTPSVYIGNIRLHSSYLPLSSPNPEFPLT